MTLNPQIKKEKNACFDGKVKLNKEETLLGGRAAKGCGAHPMGF